jgi:uncharacterized protein (DUF302 family)
MTGADEASLTEITSPFGFEATLVRVVEAIEAAKLTIFARIDHAANAREAGLTMPPTIVLIYGAAKGGTPIMLAAPRSALDLPLRLLISETPSGVLVAFHPMEPILLTAGAPESMAHWLDPAQRIILETLKI